MPSPGSAELAMDASPALEFQVLKRQQRRDLNASVRQTIEKELGNQSLISTLQEESHREGF